MSIARTMAVLLALLGLAACAPVPGAYGGVYGDSYGRGHPSGLYGSGIYAGSIYGDPYDSHYPGALVRSVSERNAYERALTNARRQALRDAEVRRQQDRARRADRRHDRAERDLDQAKRDRRRAEWRDRRPVGSGPYDRDDFERRRALSDERRARMDRDRAARMERSQRGRLDRLSRADRIQDRIDRIDRMQRRNQARQPTDREVRRLRPHQGMSETRENFDNRARRAIQRSRGTGAPVGTFLRDSE